jgi:hypothetical protein
MSMYGSRRFINDTEVRPGAVWTHNPNWQLRFAVQVVCISVNPDKWRGRITLDGRAVLETAPCDTFEQAANNARQQLIDKLAALLGDS